MSLLKESMTKNEIRDILEKQHKKHYGGDILKRELIVNKSKHCTFFELNGTPPKGFAIFIPERKILFLYEAEGRKFKEYYLQNEISDL